MKKFNEAVKIGGHRNDIAYSIALCHYVEKRYVPALKTLSDIIEKGIHEHPEWNVGGMHGSDDDVQHITNSQQLHESRLVEAFNLKAAIELQLKNGGFIKTF